MTSDALDWIYLSKVSLSFPCVLGLLEWEQRQSQTLELELAMNLDLDDAAGGDLRRTVDYSAILDQVQFIAQHGRWLLLESMAAAMARLVLAPPAPGEPRKQVRGVLVRLRKPEVLRGRAIPAVEIRRDLTWYRSDELPRADTAAPCIEILQETRQTGAYRVHIAPGAQWVVPSGTAIQIISGRLLLSDSGENAGASEELRPRAVLVGGDRALSSPEDVPTCVLAVSQPPLSRRASN